MEFEWIEFAFKVTSLLAEDDEARARSGRHHGGAEEGAGALWVMEKNVEGVIGGETGALDADVGGDGLGQAEKHERLIEQMRRKVEEDAAAGAGLLAPGAGLGSGTKTIVGGFETDETAEVAGGDGLAEGLEIGVEAAAVVNGEDATEFSGKGEEFDSFGEGSGEGFVDHDMAAGFEATLGEREMRFVGSGNSDEADGIDGK